MINLGIINGDVINGSGLFDVYKTLSSDCYVSESLNFSFSYGLIVGEPCAISESVVFHFTKGKPLFEGVKISENVSIALGNLYYSIQDEPVKLNESLSFLLQKGVLMEDQINYYLDLLIMQYKNKPKALGQMTTLISETMLDLLPSILNDAFNLDTAEGVQLDTLGKYIGMTRKVKTFTAEVILSDDDYRLLLKIKRATNNIGPSLYDIDYFINNFLSGIVQAFDYKEMRMGYAINSLIISSTLAQAIVEQDILPRPMGVTISSILYVPTMENLFSFKEYFFDAGTQVGFNTYSNYHSDYKFLTYEDTI